MASFRKLKSGWQYRISYKRGKGYREKTESGFKTKAEARIAAADMEMKLKRGAKFDKGELLFTDYMQTWYETYRKGKHSVRNDEDIEQSISFAKKYFPGIKMKDMDRETYQKAMNAFGENHATATVSKRHIYLKACLREAIEEGVIFRDPTYRASVKGKKKAKTEDQKFIGFMDAQRLSLYFLKRLDFRYISRHMILFALATGARFGEIAALTWDCVDLKDGLVKINKSWDYRKSRNRFIPTKNKASNRVITIDQTTVRWLKQLKKEQEDRFPDGVNPKGFVFINSRIDRVSNNACNKTLKNACTHFGLHKITMHGLRHTHASILLYKKLSVNYVQRRLGHANVITTMKTYSHVLDEIAQRDSSAAQDVVQELFSTSEKAESRSGILPEFRKKL